MPSDEPELRLQELEREVARLGRVERQMQRLLAVTGELAGARTREEAGRIVVDRGLDAVGASYGGVWILEPKTRTLELLAASSSMETKIARWNVLSLDLDAPASEAARTGEAIFLDSLASFEARFPASLERAREAVAGPLSAYANLPLLARGTSLGVITMAYERGQDLDASERTFLWILANQCALALERIRAEHELEQAYHEEHEAHLLAEDATHAREEILAVVSHDLRNPLGTILMGASTLIHAADANDPKAARVRMVAERIHRQSERMARLIEDLVDFARIEGGELELERRKCAPEKILTATSELFAPIAKERGLHFEIELDPDLPQVDCDSARVVQLLSSLLTNAVKVTPKNGKIVMGARAEASGVTFFVRDTGPGIEADELATLFERYWRSKQSSYKGAGLGLAIARGIVEAHTGRIWADSKVGSGSTFYFTLHQARAANAAS